MHRWLAEAFVHVPLCVDPILNAGRLALSTGADTVEAATAAIAAPDDDGLPLDDGGPGMIRP